MSISPTIAFEADDFMPLCTHQWERAPVFMWMNDQRKFDVQGQVYEGGLVTLQHQQIHWAMRVNVGDQGVVADIFTTPFRHDLG